MSCIWDLCMSDLNYNSNTMCNVNRNYPAATNIPKQTFTTIMYNIGCICAYPDEGRWSVFDVWLISPVAAIHAYLCTQMASACNFASYPCFTWVDLSAIYRAVGFQFGHPYFDDRDDSCIKCYFNQQIRHIVVTLNCLIIIDVIMLMSLAYFLWF